MASMSAPTNSDWRAFLGRVWSGHCPRCAEGALFASRFRLRQDCAECGLCYRREQGAMTGQMYLSSVVTEIFAALLVLVVFFGTDWSTSTSIAVGLPIVIVFSYWFLPKSMGLWVAIEFMTDIGNREPWIEERLPRS